MEIVEGGMRCIGGGFGFFSILFLAFKYFIVGSYKINYFKFSLKNHFKVLKSHLVNMCLTLNLFLNIIQSSNF